MQAVLDRVLVDFCVRSEKKLNDWMDDSLAATKSFPVMKADQRWLLHQLAAAYRLTAESLDAEPMRSVRFVRSAAAAIPSVSLSSATRTFLAGKMGKGGGARCLDERLVLHVLGLTVEPRLSVHDVRAMLHDWEGRFRLHWMDDDHVYAVFDAPGLRERVHERLKARGLWADPFHQEDGRAHVSVAEPIDERALYLCRKLRTTESGTVQAVVRDRERKRAVTGSDGFTSIVTVRRSAAVTDSARQSDYLPGARAPIADPSRPSLPRDGRPLVSLKGLRQLQHRNAEEQRQRARASGEEEDGEKEADEERVEEEQEGATSIASADSPQRSWRRAEAAEEAAPSARPPAAAIDVVAASAASRAVAGPTSAADQVPRDNRWAVLMSADEEDDDGSRAHESRQSRDSGGSAADVEAKEPEDDWLLSASAARGAGEEGAAQDEHWAERNSAW